MAAGARNDAVELPLSWKCVLPTRDNSIVSDFVSQSDEEFVRIVFSVRNKST